jgi:transposase
VLSLPHRAFAIERIGAYNARDRVSIIRDSDRWQERGTQGLADGAAPGYPPRITEEVRTSPNEAPFEEERARNATQVAEAVQERFGARGIPESARRHLLAVGYRWKRTRCAPSRPPNPEDGRKTRTDLEEPKRGPKELSTS